MKKSTLFTMVILLVAMLISCDKDEFNEEEAYQYEKDLLAVEKEIAAIKLEETRLILEQQALIQRVRDSLRANAGIINFSVNVVDAGNGGYVSGSYCKDSQKSNAFQSATVTVSQNGYVVTSVTDDAGIATFSDLRVGEVVVHIKSEGYTTCDFIAQIRSDWTMDMSNWTKLDGMWIPLDSTYYGVKRNSSVMVPIFPMEGASMSTIKGQITYETDLTNADAEPAYGVEVLAMIDTEDEGFASKYFDGLPSASRRDCEDCAIASVLKVAYGDVVANNSEAAFVGLNTTDANGNYELRVPSTADGLPIKIVVSEIAKEQALLFNQKNDVFVYGVQSVRTIWSSEIGSETYCGGVDGCLEASRINNVPAAYVEITAPTGETHVEPTDKTEASVKLAESGILQVNVTNKNLCATQPLNITIAQAECVDCDVWNKSAYGVTNIKDGKIASVSLTSTGKNYTDEALTVIVEETANGAAATTKATYSVVDLSKVNVEELGLDGYSSVPSVSVVSSNGTGAAAQAITTQYVDDVVLTVKGTAYTSTPTVLVKGGNPVEGAVVTAVMTTANPIHSIINVDLQTYYVETPKVAVSTGAGAKIVALPKATGRINSVDVTDGGLGYSAHKDSLPTVEITGDGFGASAHAVVANGQITSIVVDQYGQGYTNAVVTISAPNRTPYYAPRQATAVAMVGYQIDGFSVIDNGSGYTDDTKVTVGGVDVTDNVLVVFDKYIEKFVVENGGKGYTSVPEIVIVNEDGLGVNAIAVATLAHRVIGVKVVAEGEGYVSNDNNFALVFDAQNDIPGYTHKLRDAQADVLGDGVLTVTVTKGGQGYLAAPVVTNSIDGEFDMTATVRNNKVTSVTVTDGNGFDFGLEYDAVTVEFKTYCSSLEDIADALLPIVAPGAGQIESIVVTNTGRGYVVTPIVEVVNVNAEGDVVFGPGYDAKAHAVLTDGRVTSIVIDKPGHGYVNNANVTAQVRITLPNRNTTAIGLPIVVQGRITGIAFGNTNTVWDEILNPGMGYDPLNPPAITFFPSVPGKGANASAIAVVENGEIVNVVMKNQGAGYVGQNRYATAIQAGTSSFADVEDDAVAGKGFIVTPYFGTGTYSNGNLAGQGAKFVTEASKTYIKDIYLGTGKRVTDMTTKVASK